MQKNSEARRPRRSRRLLKESLLSLMRTKPFSDITVREVTDEADMNRGTFYLHYTGTADLLQSLETDLLEELQALVDAHMQETVAERSVSPVLTPVLDFVVDHRETCAVLFANSEATGFIQALQELIRRSGEPLLQAWFHPTDLRQADYFFSFLTWGFIGLLKEWFAQDMAMPRAELLSSAQRMAEASAASLFPGGRRPA